MSDKIKLTPGDELNNYEKFKNRQSLDYIRQKYNLNLSKGGPKLVSINSAVDIAVSVPEGVYNIIANFLAWLPRKGDRVDVLDIFTMIGTRSIKEEKIWRPARVLEVTKPFSNLQAFKIHYESWGPRYDTILTAVKLDRIQPPFKKTPNWRPSIKRGYHLEFLVPNNFGERYWRVGVILKNELGKLDLMTVEGLDSPYTKKRIRHIKSEFNVTLDEYYTGYSNSPTLINGSKVYLFKNIDINSEMIALRGTHLKKRIKEDKDCVNKIARRLGYF